jgi:nucleoid-associated protein YgaU
LAEAAAQVVAQDVLMAEIDVLVAERDLLAGERDALAAARDAALAALATTAATRDALQAERDAVAARALEAEALGRATRLQLDETTGALQAAQGRASSLTERLAVLLAAQSGLQQLTVAQEEELAAVRDELDATQATVALLSDARGIYTVQRGDSLSSIAAYFYRNGNRWPDILASNTNLVETPDLIFAGMVLIIPQ